MELTYGQLEATLTTHFRIHPDRVSTFRSRMKQLQRLQFPPGVNVGRGTRMTYNGEHLFQLVTAFELIAAGHAAMPACGLVQKHWHQFSAGYALAALQMRTWEPAGQRLPVVTILFVEGLHEIQFGRHAESVEASTVHVCDELAARAELNASKFDRHTTRLILSTTKILESIIEASRKRAGVQGASAYNEQFHAWLPENAAGWIFFKERYPDRSNLPMRQKLHRLYANDPESFSDEGKQEAEEFREASFDSFPF